jgi:hypothetical protein
LAITQGPLVAQHAHRLAEQELVADPLGRHVEAIGVEMADGLLRD